MPLADRYAHWQQRAKEPILDYLPIELLQDTAPVDDPEPAVLTELTEDAAMYLQERIQARRAAWAQERRLRTEGSLSGERDPVCEEPI